MKRLFLYLYRKKMRCENAATLVQRWYVAYFGVQNFAKILKESSEKKKTVVFRKRISAKTPFFSVFKSVNRSKKATTP